MALKTADKHYRIEIVLRGTRYSWVRTTSSSVTGFLTAKNINNQPPKRYRITALRQLTFLDGHSNNHLYEVTGECTGAEWLSSDRPPF